MDKAGSYGIQDDFGAVFIERVNGCFYNVVGFPLARFYSTLQQFEGELETLSRKNS
jgi:septum formation protein